MPAIPAPRITTEVPTPTFAGQSPGRGDSKPLPDGGGGVAGGDGASDAEDEPQPATLPIPIAAMTRNIAEAPALRPIPDRKSRRLNSLRRAFIGSLCGANTGHAIHALIRKKNKRAGYCASASRNAAKAASADTADRITMAPAAPNTVAAPASAPPASSMTPMMVLLTAT